eukprot:3397206-Pleurochrysis_carterae.AAC.2
MLESAVAACLCSQLYARSLRALPFALLTSRLAKLLFSNSRFERLLDLSVSGSGVGAPSFSASTTTHPLITGCKRALHRLNSVARSRLWVSCWSRAARRVDFTSECAWTPPVQN